VIEQASAGVGGTVYLEGVDGSWRETMLVELQGGSGQQSRVRGKRTTDRDLGLPHAPGRGGLCLPRCGHWPCRGPGRRELVSRASRESSRMGRSRCSKRGLTLLPPEPRAAVIASLGVDRSRDRGAGACRRLAAECSPTSSKFFAALGWSGGAGWCRTGMTGPTFLIQRQLLVDQPAGSRVCSGRWLAPGLSTNRRPLLQANVGGPSIHSIPSSSLSLASPRLASCQNPTPQHPAQQHANSRQRYRPEHIAQLSPSFPWLFPLSPRRAWTCAHIRTVPPAFLPPLPFVSRPIQVLDAAKPSTWPAGRRRSV